MLPENTVPTNNIRAPNICIDNDTLKGTTATINEPDEEKKANMIPSIINFLDAPLICKYLAKNSVSKILKITRIVNPVLNTTAEGYSLPSCAPVGVEPK